jgi:hypothetical protein
MADFVLGRLKFKWRGDWSTSTAYLIDDIVKYGGNTYVCVTNHTSAATTANFYTDFLSSSYWQLHTEGLFFKGDWTSSTFYKLNDLVKYGAYQYRCVLQHTSTSNFSLIDVSSTVQWQVYSEGLQWEDSYNAVTTYQDGDVVSYGGYTYVYVNSTPAAGQTPTDNSYWDVITTGFNNTGEYSHGTTYKTGDVVKYGGNSYVANANHTNQYPANTDGTTNTSYWDLIVKGFDFQSGGYDAATTYNIGDVVRYVSSSYVMIKDRQVNVEPGTDATTWQLIAQGDTGAVLTTRGDIIYQDASQTTRLPIGVIGSVLTTDGLEPVWSNAEGANVLYVANSGSDSNPGTQFLPFKTINHALSVATSGDVVDFDTVTGGAGGTPGTYDITQTSTLSSDGSTLGSGTGTQARVILDGSSTPTVTITNGGSGHTVGDVITFSDSGSQLGGATSVSIRVKSASVGDVVYVKNGVYRENLPLRVPAGVTIQGESLRGTQVNPATGNSTQAKTISFSSTISGATNGTYNYLHPTTSTGSGDGLVVNVTIAGNIASAVVLYHGGFGYATGNIVTLTAAAIGCGGTGTVSIQIDTLELNNAANMFLVNNQNNITQMTMQGLTGTPGGGATGKAAVVSLDPSGSISTASPYIQNCTSVNANNTGIQIDGLLHSSGNKSILANDFTQINSDGKGVHAIGGGRGEMVSVFTYYVAISFHAESGGFIRGLNCSSAYGEQGAVADGTLAAETPVSVNARGEMLNYNATTFGGAATESDIQDMIATQGVGTATVVGNTSGATATVFRTNISLDYLHIENRTGNFTQGETVTITKENSTTFTVDLDSSFGDSSAAQSGQIGPLIAVDSSDGTLSSATVITVGSNVVFAGDTNKYYRISAVSETNTGNQQALIRLTESVTTARAIANNTVGNITQNFSNVRLTGHDFLDIGTGGFADTNYPGGPNQAPDQEDEVTETNGGRVYFSSTDQNGDFRVGDLFRIQQATGIATLNADAFDLSGLSELQLGSIGAELGATINEFSTDETLGNDSNQAVPTERAIVGYTQRDQMGTGHFVPPTGTTAQRPTGGTLFTGGIRFNSSLVTWEGYNGTQWTGLGGGNPWATHTADGSTALNVAANDRYFINTTAGPQTANLPAAPQVGDQVRFLDLASTFDTNNLTIGRNGKKINNLSEDLVVSTEDSAIGLVFTGDTFGWKLIEVL